ncbi:MAG: DUF5661 family protein [Patescibacteria group bacterium]
MKNLDWTPDTAEQAGEAIGIAWDTAEFTPEDLLQGMNVELEHCSDPDTEVITCNSEDTARIAWAHLKESSAYYRNLAKMEQSFKEASARTAAELEPEDLAKARGLEKTRPVVDPYEIRAREILKEQGNEQPTKKELDAAYDLASREGRKPGAAPAPEAASEPVKIKRGKKVYKAPKQKAEEPKPDKQEFIAAFLADYDHRRKSFIIDSLNALRADKSISKEQRVQVGKTIAAMQPEALAAFAYSKALADFETKAKTKAQESAFHTKVKQYLKAQGIEDYTQEQWSAAVSAIIAQERKEAKELENTNIEKGTKHLQEKKETVDPEDEQNDQQVAEFTQPLVTSAVSQIKSFVKNPKAEVWTQYPGADKTRCFVLDVLVPRGERYAARVGNYLNIPADVVLGAIESSGAAYKEYITYISEFNTELTQALTAAFEAELPKLAPYIDLGLDKKDTADAADDKKAKPKIKSDVPTLDTKLIGWELEIFDTVAFGESISDAPEGLLLVATIEESYIAHWSAVDKAAIKILHTDIPKTVKNPGKWPDWAKTDKWFDVSTEMAEPSEAVVVAQLAKYAGGNDSYSLSASSALKLKRDSGSPAYTKYFAKKFENLKTKPEKTDTPVIATEIFRDYLELPESDPLQSLAEAIVMEKMGDIAEHQTARIQDQGYTDWMVLVYDSVKQTVIPDAPKGLLLLGIISKKDKEQHTQALARRKAIINSAQATGAQQLELFGPNAGRGEGQGVAEFTKKAEAELGLSEDEADLWRQYFIVSLKQTQHTHVKPMPRKPKKFKTETGKQVTMKPDESEFAEDISQIGKSDVETYDQRYSSVKTAVVKDCKEKDLDDRPKAEQKVCLYSEEGKLLGRHPTEESAEKQRRKVEMEKHSAYFKVNPLAFVSADEISDYYEEQHLRMAYGFYDADQAQRAQAKVTAIWKMRKARVGAELTYTKQNGNEVEFIGTVDSARTYRGTAGLDPVAITSINPFEEYAQGKIGNDTAALTAALQSWHGTQTKVASKGKTMLKVKASALLRIAELIEVDAPSKEQIRAAGLKWLAEAVKPRQRTAADLTPRVEMMDALEDLGIVVKNFQDEGKFVGMVKDIGNAFAAQKDAMGLKLWNALKAELSAQLRGMAEDIGSGASEQEGFAEALGEAIKTAEGKVQAFLGKAQAQPSGVATAEVKTALNAPVFAPPQDPTTELQSKLAYILNTIEDYIAQYAGDAAKLMEVKGALVRACASAYIDLNSPRAAAKK